MNTLWRAYLCSDGENEFWLDYSDGDPPFFACCQSVNQFASRKAAEEFAYKHDPELEHEYYEDLP